MKSMWPHSSWLWVSESALFYLTLSLFLPVSSVDAQQAAETRVIPLGVYDRQGRIIPGLNAKHIEVKGVRAAVKGIELDVGPRRIFLLLDMSDSMGGSDEAKRASRWRYATQLARDFISALQPDDSVALHLYAEKHEMLVPLTHDFASAARTIEGLSPPRSKEAKQALGYETLLGNALAAILAKQQQEPRFGDTIVLISDGLYQPRHEENFRNVKQFLSDAGIRVIWLSTAPVMPPWAKQGALISDSFDDPGRPAYVGFPVLPDETLKLAEETGGTVISPWIYDQEVRREMGVGKPVPAAKITATAQDAYRTVRNIYKVVLDLAEPVRKSRNLRLIVRDDRGRKAPPERLAYPRYITPVRSKP